MKNQFDHSSEYRDILNYLKVITQVYMLIIQEDLIKNLFFKKIYKNRKEIFNMEGFITIKVGYIMVFMF